MQEERNNYRRQETEKVEGKIKMKKEKKIKEKASDHPWQNLLLSSNIHGLATKSVVWNVWPLGNVKHSTNFTVNVIIRCTFLQYNWRKIMLLYAGTLMWLPKW